MKLASVVCRVVEDDGSEHLHNIEPAVFLDMLSAATEQQEPEDDLAALQAELDAARGHNAAANSKNAVPEGAVLTDQGGYAIKQSNGMLVLPREALIPIMQAKTRGELIEKLDELLSQFNARFAKEGE